MSGDNYSTDTIRGIIEWYARSNTNHPAERLSALSALYIGDGLRKIAQAITDAANPTEADLDKKSVFQGTCKDCSHFTADLNGVDGMCIIGDSQFNTAAKVFCWRFGPDTEDTVQPTEAEPTEGVDRAGPCWKCQHWIRGITTGGQLGYCDHAFGFRLELANSDRCTGFVERETEPI